MYSSTFCKEFGNLCRICTIVTPIYPTKRKKSKERKGAKKEKEKEKKSKEKNNIDCELNFCHILTYTTLTVIFFPN